MSHDTWTAVDEALAELLVEPDSALDAALATSSHAGLPDIAVSPNLGKFLSLLVQISGARRVLEVGTLGGYSTIWLAKSLPAGGTVTTLELDEAHANVARGNLERAGLGDRVQIRVGLATDELSAMTNEGVEPFDFIFLDADKEGYPAYFAGGLALSRPGTLIVADNVVRDGAVFDAAQSTPVLEGVRTFLSDVAAEPRVEAVGLQMVGTKGYDGIAIARVVE